MAPLLHQNGLWRGERERGPMAGPKDQIATIVNAKKMMLKFEV